MNSVTSPTVTASVGDAGSVTDAMTRSTAGGSGAIVDQIETPDNATHKAMMVMLTMTFRTLCSLAMIEVKGSA